MVLFSCWVNKPHNSLLINNIKISRNKKQVNICKGELWKTKERLQ
jgi:hypothetical protein